jgi:hypothetical protein
MRSIAGANQATDAASDAGFGRGGPLQTFDVTRLSRVVYESRRDRAAEVAVIIPLYNYADTIAEALESVANQDMVQLSVVVINDCSADGGEKRAITFLERNAERFDCGSEGCAAPPQPGPLDVAQLRHRPQPRAFSLHAGCR